MYMLKSRVERFFLGVVILVIVLIPVGSIILSQRLKVNQPPVQSVERKLTGLTQSPSPNSSSSSIDELRKSLGLSSTDLSGNTSSSSADLTGPTMTFKISIEGRPDNDQHDKVTINIAQGEKTSSPQFLASFAVDVPPSGQYSGPSIDGLVLNTTYTAYLKGSAQIDKAVTFTMGATGALLNGGNPISLTSGDLNEDNIIDQSDYDLAKQIWGATPNSSKWNANVDLNADNIINNLDLSLIHNNLGKIGDSGKWYSKVDSSASPSASLITPPNIGGVQNPPPASSGGYWMWVPTGD
jgi:hypothetical protein